MIKISDRKGFDENVLSIRGMVLVNFWTSWSDECRTMYTIMRKLVDLVDEPGAVVHVDWDRHRGLAQELQVFGVPTLLVYINGREFARYSGTMDKDDLIGWIIKAKKQDV